MPSFVPFGEFIEQTRNARPTTPAAPSVALRGVPSGVRALPQPDELDKMKSFILDHYNDGRINVSRTDLLPDGQHIDWIPSAEQPALRGMGAGEIAKTLNPPPYEGPAGPSSAPAGEVEGAPRAADHPGAGTSDPFGNGRDVPADHVPVLRLTLNRLTRFARFEDLFHKPPWRGPVELQEANSVLNAPVEGGGLQNRYHSHAAQYGQPGVDILTGAGSWMSVWAPNPGQAQFSLSQLWIVATDEYGQARQTIEGGWIVNPARYPTSAGKPVLFIFMTANDYGLRDHDSSQSGWNGYLGNMSLPGDVTAQSYFAVNPKQSFRYRIGQVFDPVSTVGGTQYGFRMQWQRNPDTMDWWLFVGTGESADMEAIGVIPSRFFHGGPLVQPNTGANVADFGGEQQNIQTPPAITTSAAPIGSGVLAEAGYPRAAFHKLITVQTTGGMVPADLNPNTPQDCPASFYSFCVRSQDPSWGTALFFGGPGSENARHPAEEADGGRPA